MVDTIFHDLSPRKNVTVLGGGRNRDLLVSSRTRIQLSHRGRLGDVENVALMLTAALMVMH